MKEFIDIQKKLGAFSFQTRTNEKLNELTAQVKLLIGGDAGIQRTGTAIAFDKTACYGTVGTPETGNITLNTTGAKLVMTQVLIHNSGSAPSFGSEFVLTSGTYTTGVLNYIVMVYINSTKVIYSIQQEQ